MAWNKKKQRPLTKAEQDYIDAKLNVYKKFYKPLKGEIVYKKKKLSQECLRRSSYNNEEELKLDAKDTVDRMNAIDPNKDWVLVSAKIIGAQVEDSNDESSNEN